METGLNELYNVEGQAKLPGSCHHLIGVSADSCLRWVHTFKLSFGKIENRKVGNCGLF